MPAAAITLSRPHARANERANCMSEMSERERDSESPLSRASIREMDGGA